MDSQVIIQSRMRVGIVVAIRREWITFGRAVDAQMSIARFRRRRKFGPACIGLRWSDGSHIESLRVR